MNEFVNKEDALAYVKNEIKEVSEKWVSFTINRLGLEKALSVAFEPNEQSIKDHDEIEAKMKSKGIFDHEKRKEFLGTLEVAKRLNFERVSGVRSKEKMLENVKENIESCEDFLEMATTFKNSLEAEMKK